MSIPDDYQADDYQADDYQADDYQAMAEQCFRRAQEAQADSERHDYLDLAMTWLEAASRVDCGPGIFALPSCHLRV